MHQVPAAIPTLFPRVRVGRKIGLGKECVVYGPLATTIDTAVSVEKIQTVTLHPGGS